MKRIIAMLLCLCMVLPLLAGCRADDPESYVPTGDALLMEDEEEVYHVEDDGTQSFSLAYYPAQGLNPLYCTDYTNRALFPLMYQSLFVTDQNYNVAPLLCGSYTVSDDLKNYTFYVASNARFSDGDRVSGEDVTASLLAAMSSGYYVGRFSHIKSISNTRDGGVLIQLNTAYENLPILLDIPIVKKEDVASDRPVGSGPYVLQGDEESLLLHRI